MEVSQVSPEPGDVATLTELLDLLTDFPSNEQRARFLLTCNWMRDRGAAAAANAQAGLDRVLAQLDQDRSQ